MKIDKINQKITISDDLGGKRLDQALALLLPDFSRTQLQAWLKNKEITVDNKPARASQCVMGGEEIVLDAVLKQQPVFSAQDIALDIIYEDESVLIINKPAGMVVHPASGHLNNTLLNAILHHLPDLQQLPRAGILHRLDKDTSGLLMIGKTPAALMHLSKQLRARKITRLYQAVVFGVLTSGGTVDAPIGRHPIKRKSMSVIETGKPAVTHYRVGERYRAHTRIKIQLETGRTHQIRVHMAHIRHSILGDPLYSGRLQLPKGATTELIEQLKSFKRQALHACELSFTHPLTEKIISFQAPLPADMQKLIFVLQEDAKNRG